MCLLYLQALQPVALGQCGLNASYPFNHGLLSVVMTFNERATQLRRAMFRASSTDMVAPLTSLAALENPWFRALCDGIESVVNTDSLTSLSHTRELVNGVSAIVVLVIAGVVLVWYLPLLQQAGRDVEATQAMLLVLPDSILASDPKVGESVVTFKLVYCFTIF